MANLEEEGTTNRTAPFHKRSLQKEGFKCEADERSAIVQMRY